MPERVIAGLCNYNATTLCGVSKITKSHAAHLTASSDIDAYGHHSPGALVNMSTYALTPST